MSMTTMTCYRHPDRRAGVTCQRCGRPICPSCMHQASVGFHCPECARAGAQRVHRGIPRPSSSVPVVTYALIAVNALVFIADLATAGGAGMWSSSGGELTQRGLLVGYGITNGGPVGVAAGEWWRIVTGGFLHAGLLHIGMNMLVLYLVGIQVESAVGRARYLALYITCLVAGSFGVLLVDPTTATVGASGAIFGLFGAVFAAQKIRGIDVWRSGIGALLVLELVFTFAYPGISVSGHIGGLVGGLVAGFVVFQLDERVESPWPAVLACAAMTVALWVGCLWAADQWRDPVLGLLAR